jgi:hypothetical protein
MPSNDIVFFWWLWLMLIIIIVIFKFLLKHNTPDYEGYRAYIDQLEAQRIAEAQAAQQEWERIQRQRNSGATQQQREQGFENLREALLGESYYNKNTIDESKEVERLKKQNKKLLERINYIENKE